MESARKPRNRKLVVEIAAVVVAAVVVSSVLFVYYSPDYSWSSSIRDHDGDGAPDKSDPRPFDASVWGSCEANLDLTVRNNSTDTLIFRATASSSALIENQSFGNLYTDPYDNLTQELRLSWLGGPVSIEVHVYLFGLVSTDWKGWSWSGNLNVTDTQTVKVSLVVPDDFQLSQWYG